MYLVWVLLLIQDEEEEDQHEVKDKHTNGAPKAVDVATTNALTEEDAVMIVAVDTDVAVITVLHVFGEVDVTFDAVEVALLITLLVNSVFVLRLVVLGFLSFLQPLLLFFALGGSSSFLIAI